MRLGTNLFTGKWEGGRERGRESVARALQCVNPIIESGLDGCFCICMCAERESESFMFDCKEAEKRRRGGGVYLMYASV